MSGLDQTKNTSCLSMVNTDAEDPRRLARDCGVERQYLHREYGDVLALQQTLLGLQEASNAQDIHVDGNRIGEIGAAVLRDRETFPKTVSFLWLRLSILNRR